MNNDVLSPYYPYNKVYNYSSLKGEETLLKKLTDYIIDLPSKGYVPIDNNDYPRCRMMKYLYYDCENPLAQPLPTTEQKMSIVYNNDNPTHPPTDKGYRIFSQYFVREAQTMAQTVIKIYAGRCYPTSDFISQLAVYFDILTNMNYETNCKTNVMSRTMAIEQALLEALNGVDIAGVGAFYFNRRIHSDCEAVTISDEYHNIGRRLVMGVQIEGGTR